MKRILFIDDERNVLEGIRRMLRAERNRWEMEFVSSGEDALLACREAPFDVVVSDLRMPRMDGAELLGHLRDQYPSTARIILSGYSETALTSRALSVAYRIVTKPCDPVELRHTIERVCTLQDVLCTPALRQVIGAIGALPSLSSTYIALSAALSNPKSDITTIAKIIEQDVAMSAKILQVVNSGFFGLTQRCTSVQQAASYLGTDTIRTLALYSDTIRTFVPDRRMPKTFCSDLQRHSQRTAIIASTLPVRREIREITLVAALLHDVGKLVLACSMADEFYAVLAKMRTDGIQQHEAEEQLLQISHAEIGGYLLGLWGIGDIAVEAIAHHHHPARIIHSGMDCSAAVYLANLLSNEIEMHPDDLECQQLSEASRQDLISLGAIEHFPTWRRLACSELTAGAERDSRAKSRYV